MLHDLSFDIGPGKIIALTGPTGSGKTTVANLIMRFFIPDSGRITIDGIDLSKISRKSLSRYVAAVLQDPWVFDGSIRDNIVYNCEGVSDEDVIRVARLTGLDGFVRNLPDGYDTIIGQNTKKVPLAQRRTIGLCRAFVRNSKILILDEAVAGLDPITGFTIFQELDKMSKDRTIIIISHNEAILDRIDTVINLGKD